MVTEKELDMVTEKELDELYEEVKENRDMFKKRIDYVYIRKSVKDILGAFKTKKIRKKVEKIIVIMERPYREGEWRWDADDKAILRKEFCKLNSNEMEYFENLLQKYCNIEKISDVQLELTLK